jgi:hypothetical protein
MSPPKAAPSYCLYANAMGMDAKLGAAGLLSPPPFRTVRTTTAEPCAPPSPPANNTGQSHSMLPKLLLSAAMAGSRSAVAVPVGGDHQRLGRACHYVRPDFFRPRLTGMLDPAAAVPFLQLARTPADSSNRGRPHQASYTVASATSPTHLTCTRADLVVAGFAIAACRRRRPCCMPRGHRAMAL